MRTQPVFLQKRLKVTMRQSISIADQGLDEGRQLHAWIPGTRLLDQLHVQLAGRTQFYQFEATTLNQLSQSIDGHEIQMFRDE